MQTLVYHNESTRTRADISRENGAKSRGPKTEEGKAISSRNCLKHGLYAQPATSQNQLVDGFEAWNNSFVDVYSPKNDYEKFIVDQITTASWKLNAVAKVQRDMLLNAEDPAEFKDVLERFDRHIALAERTVGRAHRKLADYRKPAPEDNDSRQPQPEATNRAHESTTKSAHPNPAGEESCQSHPSPKSEETNPAFLPEGRSDAFAAVAGALDLLSKRSTQETETGSLPKSLETEPPRTKPHRQNGFVNPSKTKRRGRNR